MPDILDLMYFPEASDEFKIAKSDWSIPAIGRHLERYEDMKGLLYAYSADDDIIADYGGSSGDGLSVLASARRYSFGVEPVNSIRDYSRNRHPRVRMVSDIDGEIAIYNKTLRTRFTDAEYRESVRNAKAAIVVSEFGKDAPFAEPDDLILFNKKLGLELKELNLKRYVPLRKDEFASEVMAVFIRDTK